MKGEGIGVSFGGGKLGDNKIKKIKYVVAFNGRQSMNLHTTTNQKQSAAMDGTKNGRRNEREAWGKRNTIVLGGD